MIEYNLHEDVYRVTPGISKSGLDLIHISPAHYKGSVYKESPALELGTAVHLAILEPTRYISEYTVFSGDRRTKAGKEEYKKLINQNKKIIKESDAENIANMADAINKHPKAKELLRNALTEVSVFGEDKITKEKMKGRIDAISEDKKYLIDIKTTPSSHPKEFIKSVFKYRYNVQAAMYLRLAEQNNLKPKDFIFISVEKTAPYAVSVFKLSEKIINEGYKQLREDLNTYHECKKNDCWPAFSDEIEELKSWEEIKEEIEKNKEE